MREYDLARLSMSSVRVILKRIGRAAEGRRPIYKESYTWWDEVLSDSFA